MRLSPDISIQVYSHVFRILQWKKLQQFRDFVFKAESNVKNYLERARKQLNDL
jgi:hypothetical protein